MSEPILIGDCLSRITGEDLVILTQAMRSGIQACGSVSKFSQQTGVSQATIFRLINKNGSRPTKNTLRKLVKYIGRYIPDGTVIHCYGSGKYYRFRHKTFHIQLSDVSVTSVGSQTED